MNDIDRDELVRIADELIYWFTPTTHMTDQQRARDIKSSRYWGDDQDRLGRDVLTLADAVKRGAA